MTEALLKKYSAGLCDADETRVVEQWLHDSNAEELDKILLPMWWGESSPMPAALQRSLWSRLRKTRSTAVLRKLPAGTRLRRIGMAAAVVLVMAVVSFFAVYTNDRKPSPATSLSARTIERSVQGDLPAPAWTSIVNSGSGDRKFNLEDGTDVVLGRGSMIRYLSNFESGRRNIYLKGSGLFHVAKDPLRPLTVYSGDISTTALGTVFGVSADSNDKIIRVRLFQGSVVVRSGKPSPGTWSDLVLAPGEEAIYDNRKMTASVIRTGHYRQEPQIIRNRDHKADSSDLHFSNTALSEVFERLMRHYHQKIDYRKSDIMHKDFTGVVSAKDSLSVILTVIANMNQLRMVQQDKIFVIRKSSR